MHTVSYKRVDTTRGRYLSLGAIVETYGIASNRREAVRCGINVARKCAALGGSWILWDSFAQTWLYLALDHEWQSDLEKAWTQYEEWQRADERMKDFSCECENCPACVTTSCACCSRVLDCDCFACWICASKLTHSPFVT